MKKPVITNMLWVPKQSVPNLNAHRQSLTVRSRFPDVNGNLQAAIPLYRETPRSFGFPRHHPTSFADGALDKTSLGEPLKALSITPVSVFRDSGQQQLFDKACNAIDQGETGLTINAPTGVGKTCIALHVAARINRKTIIVVYKSDMLEQWRMEITKHLSVTPEQVGIGRGGVVDWEDKDIVIALVHTLRKNKWGKRFRRYFGTAIFDEVDRSTSPQTFAPVVSMFHARYRICISATLKRKDGLHVIYQHHAQSALITPGAAVAFKKLKSVVVVKRIDKIKGAIPSHLAAHVRRTLFLKKIQNNYHRNAYIAEAVKSLFDMPAERRIVVFAEWTRVLFELHKLLVARYAIDPRVIGYYTASRTVFDPAGVPAYKTVTVKKAEQEHTLKSSRILLATYKMMEAATDAPELSAMVLATPRTDVVQLEGRISRFLEGKATPIICDIVDYKHPDAVNWFEQRLFGYKSLGLRVIN